MITGLRAGRTALIVAALGVAGCGLIGPSAWQSESPVPRIHYCDREYLLGDRSDTPLAVLSPVFEARDGEPFPQAPASGVVFGRGRECPSLVQVHDDRGWVVYRLAGAP